MSRRNATGRNIRGPQSALTDFLATNNISAAQIRQDYDARRQAAAQAAQNDADQAQPQEANDEEEEVDDDDEEAVIESRNRLARKRKRETEAAVEKIKKGKAFKRRKKGLEDEPGASDDEYNDLLALDMYEKSRPPPGQLEHCEICEKRFTVTAYSKEGPNGGLLCTKCGKELKDQEKKDAKKTKKPVQRKARRQVQSNLLDGLVRYGPKSLVDLCVEKIADENNDIDDFGDIGDHHRLLAKVSQAFSKRRVLDSRTSKLFLTPDYEHVILYDCGKLHTEDFSYIFSVVPTVKHLNLRNAGQMKDETIDYILKQGIKLESMQLEACNLITDAKWQEFFEVAGADLTSFKISWLDFAMIDATIESMVKHCPNLKRLKIKRCFKLTEESLAYISELKHLEHLSLYMLQPISEDAINNLISAVGPNLKTLSLEHFEAVSNTTLEIIHTTCHKLKKLRLVDNDYAHDVAYESLFTNWSNPALEHIDLNSSRDIDNQNPDGPEDEPIGLGDKGLVALLQHSGLKLKKLNIPSCRHITRATLGEVFDGKRKYPSLQEVDMSLLPDVDDVVLAGLFKSCPKIIKVTVFACFGVKDIVVPKGVALIGTPHAHEAIVQEGTS